MGGAPTVSDTEAPNIGGVQVVAIGPVLDSTDVGQLAGLIVRARESECPTSLPKPCEYSPRYCVRFLDFKPSLDVLWQDCERVSFSRGGKSFHVIDYCDPEIGVALERLLHPGTQVDK